MSPRVHRNKGEGKWSETCIGLWTRNMTGSSSAENSSQKQKSLPICTGINLIRVQNMDISTVKPTSTVGMQIIIQDTESMRKVNDNQVSGKNQETRTVAHQQKILDFLNYLTTVKEKSNELTQTVQEIANSEQKLRRIGDIASKSYDSLREWFDQYWK